MHALADSALPGPAMFRHGLIHDDDRRRIVAIVRSEKASFQQRYAHGLEIATIGDRKHGELQFPLGEGPRPAMESIFSLRLTMPGGEVTKLYSRRNSFARSNSSRRAGVRRFSRIYARRCSRACSTASMAAVLVCAMSRHIENGLAPSLVIS